MKINLTQLKAARILVANILKDSHPELESGEINDRLATINKDAWELNKILADRIKEPD